MIAADWISVSYNKDMEIPYNKIKSKKKQQMNIFAMKDDIANDGGNQSNKHGILSI